MFLMTAVALALAPEAAAYRGPLQMALAERPFADLQSRKRPSEIEICVADALTGLGAVSSFRDGEDGVVLAATPNNGITYTALVRIKASNDGSFLMLSLSGKDWRDRLKSRVAACL